ncbi:MAG: four helix bundle protein [Candidatus Parcubacteria bacterium]|nr:four helix bundle protein [Candidatus Parcubacteria bacterium]
MKFDLEERTTKFGENIILFCQTIGQNSINQPLINQIVRSATSIGANYYEANEAGTKKDFYNKIYISKKEANETKHWLRLIAVANPTLKDNCRALWGECHEIVLILSKIVANSRNSSH